MFNYLKRNLRFFLRVTYKTYLMLYVPYLVWGDRPIYFSILFPFLSLVGCQVLYLIYDKKVIWHESSYLIDKLIFFSLNAYIFFCFTYSFYFKHTSMIIYLDSFIFSFVEFEFLEDLHTFFRQLNAIVFHTVLFIYKPLLAIRTKHGVDPMVIYSFMFVVFLMTYCFFLEPVYLPCIVFVISMCGLSTYFLVTFD